LPEFLRPSIDPPAFDLLPDGFTVHRIGSTGVIAVDNFCTDEECEHLISRARDRLQISTVVDESRDKPVENEHRRSSDAAVYSMRNPDPIAHRFVVRAAMLLGLPPNHAEKFPVTHYSSGGYFREHMDAFTGFFGDRHYTVLVYLNEVGDGAGGETVFPKLNITSKPRKKRAIIWRNYNNDGTVNELSQHAALTLAEGAEKWVVQLGFRRYPMFNGPQREAEAVSRPLAGSEDLPAGVIADSRT
jgi:prolyl 4-hydroxylase